MISERFYSNMHHMIIPLYGFKNYHHANNNGEEIDDFIGRSSIKDKLASWLRYPIKNHTPNSKNQTIYKGAYLITGNRGMGKSTFVHSTIKKLQEEKTEKTRHKYIPVTVNVGNELLAPRDLLAIICKLTKNTFDKETRGFKVWIRSRYNVIFATLFLFLALLGSVLLSYGYVYSFHAIAKLFCSLKLYIFLMFIFLICLLTSNSFLHWLWGKTDNTNFITIHQIKNEWEYLIERINATVTTSTEIGSKSKDDRIYNLGLFFKYGKTVAFPIADVPEMQELMVALLDLISRYRRIERTPKTPYLRRFG